MKNKWIVGILAFGMLFLTSCSVFTNKGKAAKAEERGRVAITNIDYRRSTNITDKIQAIADYAHGTDYALSKINEPPREVVVARSTNQRVMSLAGTPTAEKMKEMQDTIDKLTSLLATERDRGKKDLTKKDMEIAALQAVGKNLDLAKNTEIQKYMTLAQNAAAATDAYKAELNKMDSWFGLGAIFYGIKKFLISSAWILGIGGALFFVLRIASASNPICGAIFGIFEQIVSWGIHAVRFLFPKAIQLAGHVTTEVYDSTRLLLRKIVDSIQSLKDVQSRNAHDITLKELLVELEKTMDVNEKETIAEIKRQLGY